MYFANDGDTIRTHVTVGQGNNNNLIGTELMFAHQLDNYYEDPILIIKTAWGGKSLAEDFRPPSFRWYYRGILFFNDRDSESGIR